MSIDLTVICPIHNEAGNISELCQRLSIVLGAMVEQGRFSTWEILLINDASSDDSAAEMEQMTKQYQGLVFAHHHAEQRGQKGAIMTGFAQARGRISVTMDADLQVLPEELPRVLAPILDENYQMVCTFNDPQRDVYHKQRYDRSTVSYIGNIFMRTLFNSPVRDAGSNFMALETRFIRGVQLLDNDQRYLLPITARRGLNRITEVGCEFAPRKHGKSKYKLWKKAILGLPEMFVLKYRLLRGIYDQPSLETIETEMQRAAAVAQDANPAYTITS